MYNIKRFTGKTRNNKYFSENYNEEIIVEELPEFIQGSGCFGKGTLVLTAHGIKAIDRLTLKDSILGYDRFGEIDFAKINKIISHKKAEFVDDIYYIYTEKGLVWPKGITGNHAVYNQVDNSHKEIKDFKIGDNLSDYNGNLIPITDIHITQHSDLADNFEVFDLTVTPQHTFFCGTEYLWVRVHNSGGGKSSQATNMSTGIEAPNTLQASSVAYVLDLISHGPIVGVNGGNNISQGVYFNNTLVESTQGQQNFTGRILISGYYSNVYPFIAATTGTPDQPVLAGFTDVETTIYGGNQLISYNSSDGLIVTIPDSGKQAVRVTLNFANGLWQQFYSNGNIEGFNVSFNINVTSIGGSWYPAVSTTLGGKTTSQYMVDYIIQAPPECIVNPNLEWAIQVVRNQPDDVISTVQATQSTFYLFSVTEILYQQNSYPNMALVGLQVPAIAVGNSIPTRGYFVKGMIVQVPSNYDPINRTYGGTLADPTPPSGSTPQTYSGATNAGSTNGFWDGTFKWAWTDNTAWIEYDIISNNTYGLGEYLGQAVPLNKWSFYEASLYNDCTTWNPVTKQYTKTLIPQGSTSTWVVTDIRTDGSSVAYVTVPGHSVTAGQTITLSGIPNTNGLNVVANTMTGANLYSLNTTHGVASVTDGNNIVINLSSTIASSLVSAIGMQLLDNTTAGYEHRFIFNAPLNSQQDAWQLIQAIASNMHAVITVVNGEVTVIQDRPKTPVRYFNNSSVIGGLFTYSSSEITSRTTAVNVTFNDKNNLYLPKTVSEWHQPAVDLYGFIASDLVAFGCVDESQARRLARTALFTAIDQQDLNSFTTGLNVLDLSIGDVIGTQDNTKIRPNSEFLTGRVIACTGIGTTSVTFTLDRPVTLIDATYNFAIPAPDGYGVLQDDGTTAIQSYLWVGVVTSPTTAGTYSSLTVQFQEQVGFTPINLPACSTSYIGIDFYAYASNQGETDLWMVQAITESQRGQFTISCIQYNPNKWSVVEGGLSFTPIKLPSGLLSSELPSPGTIIFQPVFTNNGVTTTSYLLVSWGWNQTTTDSVQFNLSYQVNNGNWINVPNLGFNNYEIANAIPGIYNVLVQAVNLAGVASPQVYNSYNYYISSTTFTPITGQTGNLLGNADLTGSSISKALTIGTTVNATSITPGQVYIVKSIGTLGSTQTDFTLIGSPDNIQGTQFTATAVGIGSGTVLSVTANTTAWDTYEFSSVGYTSSFAVQFQFATLTSVCVAGLDTGISGSTDSHTLLTNFQFGIYVHGGLVYITESGTSSSSYGAYALADIFEVAYSASNNTISYFKNGTLLRTATSFTLGTSSELYFNSIYNSPGSGINNLQIGTYIPQTLSDLLPPTNFEVIGTTGTSFVGQDLQVVWTENPANNHATNIAFNTGSGLGGVGTNVIPLVNTTDITVGETVSGIGLPANTTIVSIDTIANTIQVSNNLLVNGQGNYTFNVTVSTLYQYVLEIIVGTSVVNTYIVPVNAAGTGGFFDYTFARNQADHSGTASRSVTMRVFAQDTLGNASPTYTQATFTNPQAAIPTSFSVMAITDGVIVTITPDSEADLAGYVVWRGATSGFTKDLAHQVYNGQDLSVTIPTPDNNTYYYAVGEYDTFGQDGILNTSETTQTSTGTSAVQWSMQGITFSVAGSTVSWTSGTIYKSGVSTSISSGSATYTSGVLYIYYSGTGTTLSTTNTTAVAVGYGSGSSTYPLATYDSVYGFKGGDGSAFISGSQVLAATLSGNAVIANSLLASSLNATTAYITNTLQVANAVISSASIKNVIQSANYSTSGHTGWSLNTNNDSSGSPVFNMYAGAFNLYDSLGGVIFSASNGWDGAYIKNATIGAAQIKTAAIGSLQLAGHAVTVPVGFYTSTRYTSGLIYPATAWFTIPNFSLTVNNPGNNSNNTVDWLINVTLIGTLIAINAYGSFAIYFDSTVILTGLLVISDASGNYILPQLTVIHTDTVPGNHTITVQLLAAYGTNAGLDLAAGSAITAVGGMT